jgi:hypothetical protein
VGCVFIAFAAQTVCSRRLAPEMAPRQQKISTYHTSAAGLAGLDSFMRVNAAGLRL